MRTIEAEFEYRDTITALGLVTLKEQSELRIGHGGRYALRKKIGRGAMGVVYLADDLELRRSVAVKIVLRASYQPEEYERRLRREAWALARVDHQNVVQIYDVDSTNSSELFRFPRSGRRRSSQVGDDPISKEMRRAIIILSRCEMSGRI